MTGVIIALAAVLGCAIGSFANVVVYRVPRGESVLRPPSACPKCGHAIRARHNVPILGWLWLRGKCADCGNPISIRYPLVEAGTGVAYALIVWHWGLTWTALLLLVFAAFTIVLALIDLDVRRLPDVLVGPLAASVALIVIANSITGAGWPSALRALIGAAAVGLLYGVAWFVYPKGLGFGDVKLAPVIGAVLGYFGWGALAVGTFAGFLWGAVVGVGVMIATRNVRKVKIPFGPWMLLGAWTGILWGNAIWDWYLHDLMGL